MKPVDCRTRACVHRAVAGLPRRVRAPAPRPPPRAASEGRSADALAREDVSAFVASARRRAASASSSLTTSPLSGLIERPSVAIDQLYVVPECPPARRRARPAVAAAAGYRREARLRADRLQRAQPSPARPTASSPGSASPPTSCAASPRPAPCAAASPARSRAPASTRSCSRRRSLRARSAPVLPAASAPHRQLRRPGRRTARPSGARAAARSGAGRRRPDQAGDPAGAHPPAAPRR